MAVYSPRSSGLLGGTSEETRATRGQQEPWEKHSTRRALSLCHPWNRGIQGELKRDDEDTTPNSDENVLLSLKGATMPKVELRHKRAQLQGPFKTKCRGCAAQLYVRIRLTKAASLFQEIHPWPVCTLENGKGKKNVMKNTPLSLPPPFLFFPWLAAESKERTLFPRSSVPFIIRCSSHSLSRFFPPFPSLILPFSQQLLLQIASVSSVQVFLSSLSSFCLPFIVMMVGCSSCVFAFNILRLSLSFPRENEKKGKSWSGRF